MNPRSVSFNSSDLESSVPGLLVLELPDRDPTRGLNMSSVARTDSRTLNSNFYTSRKVNVVVSIARSSRALLEDSIDTLKGILAPKEKTLRVPYGSYYRDYTATWSNVSRTDQQGGYVKLDLEFECSDSMGYSQYSYDLVSTTRFTTASKSFSITTAGTAEEQLPVIKLILVAITGGTSASISIGNHNTGQTVTITRTFSNDDVITINCKNRTVQVNGIDADFTGAIPSFGLGAQQIDYVDTLTTRTADMLVTYQKRYI